MSTQVREIVQKLVDAETKGWDEKNIEPFLSMIHPDMAWPFAPTPMHTIQLTGTS